MDSPDQSENLKYLRTQICCIMIEVNCHEEVYLLWLYDANGYKDAIGVPATNDHKITKSKVKLNYSLISPPPLKTRNLPYMERTNRGHT
jgi:hypothetical protein